MQGGILSPGNRIGRDLEKGNMRREIGICVVKIWQVMVGPYIPLLQTTRVVHCWPKAGDALVLVINYVSDPKMSNF